MHPRALPPDHAMQDGQGERSTPRATSSGLHMRISGQSILTERPAAEALQNGRDPVTFQGLNPSGPEACDRLHASRTS